MAIFAIIELAHEGELQKKIEEEFPGNFFQVGDGHWLVSSGGTAEEIGRKIKLDQAGMPSTIVYNLSGYWGRASVQIWEWLKANWPSSGA
ncbi:MAG: hypothetical protein AB1405_02085 [Bdellovibrionota bacterium]